MPATRRERTFRIKVASQPKEIEVQEALTHALHDNPIPSNEQKWNLPLFLNRQALSKLMGMAYYYQQILPVTGGIMEFGVRWGHNMALMTNLRGMLEPFNHTRRIVGFDTFAGFTEIHEKDGRDKIMTPGAFGVTDGYEAFLTSLLRLHEHNAPISHIQKFELIKGDAKETLPRYLKANPHFIVAFAYFDFDLYRPTRDALELLLPRCTKGTVLAFDEIHDPIYPGETQAVMEVLGLGRYPLRRNPYYVTSNYCVID